MSFGAEARGIGIITLKLKLDNRSALPFGEAYWSSKLTGRGAENQGGTLRLSSRISCREMSTGDVALITV